MIYKVIVEYFIKLGDDEFGTFQKTFTNLKDAMDFIETKEKCYTFKVKVLRNNG